jgi:hypothetical protein
MFPIYIHEQHAHQYHVTQCSKMYFVLLHERKEIELLTKRGLLSSDHSISDCLRYIHITLQA